MIRLIKCRECNRLARPDFAEKLLFAVGSVLLATVLLLWKCGGLLLVAVWGLVIATDEQWLPLWFVLVFALFVALVGSLIVVPLTYGLAALSVAITGKRRLCALCKNGQKPPPRSFPVWVGPLLYTVLGAVLILFVVLKKQQEDKKYRRETARQVLERHVQMSRVELLSRLACAAKTGPDVELPDERFFRPWWIKAVGDWNDLWSSVLRGGGQVLARIDRENLGTLGQRLFYNFSGDEEQTGEVGSLFEGLRNIFVYATEFGLGVQGTIERFGPPSKPELRGATGPSMRSAYLGLPSGARDLLLRDANRQTLERARTEK